MRTRIQDRKSECCNADMRIITKELPEGVREIFYFVCMKCKKLCHMKKK